MAKINGVENPKVDNSTKAYARPAIEYGHNMENNTFFMTKKALMVHFKKKAANAPKNDKRETINSKNILNQIKWKI